MNSFYPGQYVHLKENKEEGFPSEYGTYEGESGADCHVVRIERKYRTEDDDGLREVTTAQIEKATRVKKR